MAEIDLIFLYVIACVSSGLAGVKIAKRYGWPGEVGFLVGAALPVLGLYLMRQVKEIQARRRAQKGASRG